MNAQEYVWHDLNGNGKYDKNEYIINTYKEYDQFNGLWPDKNGNLLTCYRNKGIRRLSIDSFDNYSNPIYTFKNREYYDIPKFIFQDILMMMM